MNKTAFIPVYKRKLDSEHWFGFENIETDNIVWVIFQSRSLLLNSTRIIDVSLFWFRILKTVVRSVFHYFI